MSDQSSQIADHEALARAYLADILGDDAPESLEHDATYLGQPLENEGDMSVFSFNASVGGDDEASYFVVAGQTEPNYYPSWGLSPEQMYDLHLGTRFMLVMEVSAVPAESLPDDLADQVRAFIGTVAPGYDPTEIRAMAAFNVAGEIFAVCSARIDEEEVYVFCLASPPGIYRDVHLPPQVVFRLHMGQLIRRESSQSDGD
jgi:hypothetical protein